MSPRSKTAAEERATDALAHYFRMVWQQAGLRWDSDNEAEVRGIVHDIIDAVGRA